MEEKKVLVTHEHRFGMRMTKFPGGGHIPGEGLADCLKREFMEEVGIVVETAELIYLNDFFQRSAFDPEEQLIVIYYRVKTKKADEIVHTPYPEDLKEGEQVFEWIPIRELQEKNFTFPLDREVVKKLKAG